MIIRARTAMVKSRARRYAINGMLHCITRILAGIGINHAVLLIIDGKFGCMELTQSETDGGPEWATLYSDDEPENKPSIH